LNASLLDRANVHSADVASYFESWAYDILRNPKFIIYIDPTECQQDGCRSIFVPGNVETAHIQGQLANVTLLDGRYFNGSDTVMIQDAEGVQIEFTPLPEDYSFDFQDCILYGKEHGDGFVLCLAQINPHSMASHHLALPS